MLETLALMGQGFVKALTLINLLAMVGGVTLGIIIGCLPGLSAAMGVALMLPLTFTMPADTGLIVLGAIYCGAIFGGSISAILIHTPGTPASAATAIEGYQMTLKGQAGKALATACWSSFWGGLLSCISLYFFAPLLAQLALKFMSAEKFWLGIFGLTIIAGVSSKSIVKGLMSGALGLLLSTIGLDPIDGTKRFMFGHAFLAEGINTTCALIGLFSMSQVLILAEKKIKERQKASKFSDKIALTKAEKKMLAPTVIRSWIIGNIIGILPGAGASIACFMGYNNAKQFSKHKEDFGHGAIEGVCGSEAANNAVTGGSLIPMLTLGIPGESVTSYHSGSHPGPRALHQARGDDLHVLRGLCSRAVLHAVHRHARLPRLCADLPPVRRHSDPLRHGALLHRLLRHPPQHERRGRHDDLRRTRLSDAEIRFEYRGGRSGTDSWPDQ